MSTIDDFKIPESSETELFKVNSNIDTKLIIGRMKCPTCNKRVFLLSRSTSDSLFFSFLEEHLDNKEQRCLASLKLTRKLLNFPIVSGDCEDCPFPHGCACCDGEWWA